MKCQQITPSRNLKVLLYNFGTTEEQAVMVDTD